MESASEIISLLCPTRKRPNNVVRFINSAYTTVSEASRLRILFYVDDDDFETINLAEKYQQIDNKIRWIVRKRIILSEMTNILAKEAQKGILFLLGDDVVFETKNWDIEIRKEFLSVKDNILLVYGKDGIMNERLATHSCIHSKWVEILGHIVPPIFPGDWVDNWMTKISESLGRKIYREDLLFTHMHPTVGKANFDEVYIEKYLRDRQARPDLILEAKKDLLEEDINKLRDYMNG